MFENLEVRNLLAGNPLIGVDFGPAGNSPANWQNFDKTEPTLVSNLKNELGVSTTADLYVLMRGTSPVTTPFNIPSTQLPQSEHSLAGLNGVYRDDAEVTLAFRDLKVDTDYELYVFAGDSSARTQSVEIIDALEARSFTQTFSAGQFVVNDKPGSSSQPLTSSAKAVKSTDDGRITIQITGSAGADWALAGVALREKSAPVKPDIKLNSVTSNGGTLTVNYTITGADVPAFRLGAIESSNDTYEPTLDTARSTLGISSAADLTVGTHSKSFAIGTAVKLPGAGLPDLAADRHLLFVADYRNLISENDATPFNEDNNFVFRGSYFNAGGVGTVTVVGSDAGETIRISNSGSSISVATAVRTILYPAARVTAVYVAALAGNDRIIATGVARKVIAHGGSGNDLLQGGIGRNELYGGLGDDNYVYTQHATADRYVELKDQGVDTLDLSMVNATLDITIDGSTDILALSRDKALIQSSNDAEALNWENVTGGLSYDFIIGNDNANILKAGDDPYVLAPLSNIYNSIIGNGGNDTIFGSRANDSIFDGNGDDTIIGGGGSDLYQFDKPLKPQTDTVIETIAQGEDTLSFAGTGATNPVNVNLSTTSYIIATQNNRTVRIGHPSQAAYWDNASGTDGPDHLIGNSLNNSLGGRNGNDILEGKGGSDVLDGSEDSDTYVFAPGIRSSSGVENDVVQDFGSKGRDTLDFTALTTPLLVDLSSKTVALGSSANRVLTTLKAGMAAKIENVMGGSGVNTIFGNAAGNVLVGGNAADEIRGNGGNDIIIGGKGADKLYGGLADDILIGGTTDLDRKIQSLDAVILVWLPAPKSKRTFTEAVSAIRAGVTLRDGTKVVLERTVHKDAAVDFFWGDEGQNWGLIEAIDKHQGLDFILR